MADTNPIAASEDTPKVSVRTVPVAGLLLDVYGLEELAASSSSASSATSDHPFPVSCLWLLHPRLRQKEDMADIAHRMLSAYYHHPTETETDSSERETTTATTTDEKKKKGRGLIAIALDARNHGTRLVDPRANEAWRKGNPAHAQDMFATVSGTASDASHLMDVVGSSLFGARGGPPAPPSSLAGDDDGAAAAGKQEEVEETFPSCYLDHHLALGVSLGGHSAWHLVFAEPRVEAAVCVVGCPDYMELMRGRARRAKLPSFPEGSDGAAFIGGPDFPRGLVAACRLYDPRALTSAATTTTTTTTTTTAQSEQERVQKEEDGFLSARLRGKRILALSGADDRLVPYAAGEGFLRALGRAARASSSSPSSFSLEDNVYTGVGHKFAEPMVRDAVRFVLDAVAAAGSGSPAADRTSRGRDVGGGVGSAKM